MKDLVNDLDGMENSLRDHKRNRQLLDDGMANQQPPQGFKIPPASLTKLSYKEPDFQQIEVRTFS